VQRMKRATNQSLDEVELANSCVNRPEPHLRQEAIEFFLRTIKEHRPDVLDSLHRDVWPAHRELFHPDCGIPLNQAILNQSEDTISFNPQSSDWYNYFFWKWRVFSNLGWEGLVPSPYQERLILLREAISNWAERFRLTDEWCLDHILITLYEWSQSEQPGDDWRYQQRVFYSEGDLERLFKFEFSAWHVDAEDWASYRKSLEERFLRTLLAYRAHQEDNAKSRKISLARKKRNKEHYQWLVDFHVPQADGKTFSDSKIAEKYDDGSGLDRSSVYEAIHSTASLIGLTLSKQ